MPNPITIVVPIGPDPRYLGFLDECLTSIVEQMEEGDEILIVDDQAHLSAERFAAIPVPDRAYLHYVRNEWLLGAAASWNVGVALANNMWCILMGSDDKLMPGCLNACREVLATNPRTLNYFNITCQLETGEIITAWNNAAMVSKDLWDYTGGFPITASVGGPDALLISILLKHHPETLQQIKDGTPLYWCRVGDHQDTLKQAAPFSWEIVRIRDIETGRWKSPEWTRNR